MGASRMNSTAKLLRQNLRLVKELYPGLTRWDLAALRDLTKTMRLSVALGELVCLDGKWYVTHAGLLRIAQRSRCSGIRTALEKQVCDPTAGRWVFKATVYKGSNSKGFVGYGDADPSNVSSLVRGAEMRVAETRAVNRALRKAYGIGLCSVEEIGSFPLSVESNREGANASGPSRGAVSSNGQPCLRDQLRQLIGKYRLDAALVKRYAAEFCQTEDLRQAKREQVEAFVNHLAEWAAKDRASLVCKLNAYLLPEEVKA